MATANSRPKPRSRGKARTGPARKSKARSSRRARRPSARSCAGRASCRRACASRACCSASRAGSRRGDIAIFSRQLATMMTAGIPLVQSFDIVGAGHENPAMQKLILAIKGDVEGGTALADALAKHPLHFDDLFVSLVVGRRASRRARDAARQDRHLQGKDRGHQEEDQEGLVLSGRRRRRRDRRDGDPVDLRHSGVRVAVPGLRRRPARRSRASSSTSRSSCRAPAGSCSSRSSAASGASSRPRNAIAAFSTSSIARC